MRLKFGITSCCVSFLLLIHHTCWLATIIVQAKSDHHHHSKSHRSQKIWGSLPARQGRWEFMALIKLPYVIEGRSIFGYCSAILINNRSLLTAAHCFNYYTKKEPIQVLLRGLSFKTYQKMKFPDILHKTFSYIVYDRYEESKERFESTAYDIAIIKLRKAIVLDPQRGIDRVDLPIGPDGRQYPFDPANCYLVGYGDEKPEYQDMRLQEVKVPILPRAVCKKHVYDIERQICYGYKRKPSKIIPKASASGDSGGAFLCKTIHFHTGKHTRIPRYCLIAMNTRHEEDELQERISIGVRITKYMDWIKQYS